MNINLTMSTDDNYCMHTCSLIMSILKNSDEDYYKFYIFYSNSGLSKKNRDYLAHYFQNYNCALIFKEINRKIFSDLTCSIDHISEAANYRIISFDMIPEKRVIYLDIDMIVLSNLRELFNFNIKDFPVGAVSDYALGLFDKKQYFNSGMLLVDLQKWKAKKYSKKLIDYLKKNDGLLNYPDQDALNHILKNKWLNLPLKFNRQKIIYELNERDLGIKESSLKDLRKRPAIIHYTGPIKPWHFRYVFPDKREYVKYIKKTKWKNQVNKDLSVKNCLFFFFRYLVYMLMLRRLFEKKLISASKWLRLA